MNYRFREFLDSDLSNSDYIFIDPPWNYPPTKFSSEFWKELSYIDLFQEIKSPMLFIYVTLDNLPLMMSSHLESEYDLKALIPYARVKSDEGALYSITHGFKNQLQYVAVFQSSRSDVNISTLCKDIIVEDDNSFKRPIKWEEKMFLELMSQHRLEGVYILPEGTVAATTNSNISSISQMSKKELF